MFGTHAARTLTVKSCLLIVGILVAVASVDAQSRSRIAVIEFDDRIAGTQGINLGARVADALISKLAGGSTFDVVDRQNITRIIAEQNLKLNDRFDASNATRIGKLANLHALVMGLVDGFDSNVSVESSSKVLFTNVRNVGTVKLKVTARLIDIETGAILVAPTATAENKSVISSVNVSQGGQQPTGPSNAIVQSALSKLIDKSVDDVVQRLAAQISASSTRIQGGGGTSVSMGKVIGMDGGLVLINRGASAGIKTGSTFVVVRSVDTGLKDPDTGQPVIRRRKICNLVIAETEDLVSAGKCDGDPIQAGDELTPGSTQ
jgi:curli biogenesis system outer membrane secretion channel CsgG